MTPPRKGKRKRQPTKYKPSLELSHGVLPPTGLPPSSSCQFCVSFSRERAVARPQVEALAVPASLPVAPSPAAPGASNTPAAGATGATQADAGGEDDSSDELPKKKQRRPSQVVLSFSDFSKHRIEEHYRLSHEQRWAEYKDALAKKGPSRDTNAAFFSKTKITAHFSRCEPGSQVVEIRHEIGLLSKDLYARETDIDPRTESGIVLSYGENSTPVEDIANLGTVERESLHFVTTLPSMPTFLHVMFLVICGLSFSQVQKVFTRERSVFAGVKSKIMFVSRREAALFTRLTDVLGLRSLSKVLRGSWTFSLAADGSAQIAGTAYFAIMARVPPVDLRGDIETLHIVAPPLRGSHTGESMFDLTAKVLHALDSSWSKKLMGATSDGAGNMVGVDLGWQTRLEEASLESGESVFYLYHCGPHKVNIVNGKAVIALEKTGSGWMAKFHDIIKWTRKEANLVEEMGTQAKNHISVRWVSLEASMKWFRDYSDRLEEHYVTKDKEIAEDTQWWIVLILLHEHFRILKVVFALLQHKTLLLESQSEIFFFSARPVGLFSSSWTPRLGIEQCHGGR